MLLSSMRASSLFERFPQRRARAALAVLALLGVLCDTALAAEALPRDPPLVAAGASYVLPPGRQLLYRLEYENSSATDIGTFFDGQEGSSATQNSSAASGLKRSFQTRVSGDFEMTVIEDRGDSLALACRFAGPSVLFEADGQRLDAEARTIERDLRAESLVIMTKTGNILSVRMGPAAGRMSLQFFRSLLSFTQFVLPADSNGDATDWQVEEADPAGRYVARYLGKPANSTSDGRARMSFQKSKIRYVSPPAQSSTKVIVVPNKIVPKGEFTADFDHLRGILLRMKGSESQSVVLNRRTIATSETVFSYELKSDVALQSQSLSTRRASIAELERVSVPMEMWVAPSPGKSDEALARQQLGSDTLESLTVELKKSESVAKSLQKETELYLKFKALAYLQPQSCERLGALLAAADARGVTFRVLADALSSTGSAPAQNSLVQAIRARPSDMPALLWLIPSLGRADDPGLAAEQVLRELAWQSSPQDIASSARFALGSMARRLAVTSPERSEKIIDDFLERYREPASPEEMIHFLYILGNAGSRRSLQVVREYSANDVAALRAAAMFALRFVPSPEADEILIRAMGTDQDPAVRLRAVDALGFRQVNDKQFDALKGAFQSDSNVQVRLRVLSNLSKAVDEYPEVREIVKLAAETDSSEDVRTAAGKMMLRLPSKEGD